MAKSNSNSQLLKKREAAERLRISIETLDHHVKNGLLASIKMGKFVFFRESDLEQFIRSCERKPKARRHGRGGVKELRI